MFAKGDWLACMVCAATVCVGAAKAMSTTAMFVNGGRRGTEGLPGDHLRVTVH